MKRHFFYDPQARNTGGVEPKKPDGVATTEQIAKWKQEFRQGIFALVVEGKIYYFKKPTRQILNYASSMSDKQDATVLDYWDSLAPNLLLEGQANTLPGATDETFEDFRAIVAGLKQATETKKHELVNL